MCWPLRALLSSPAHARCGRRTAIRSGRSAAAPLAEAAVELKGYELLNWFGLFAPAATPSPIVARLNEIVVRGLRDRAISETLDAQGILPRIMTPGQYREFVAAETEKFGKIVAQANIKVEN
jgi:tripartite-type tricarboxylate transporter receptor subunit TctC